MGEWFGLFRHLFASGRATAAGTLSLPPRPGFLSVSEPEGQAAEDASAEQRGQPEREPAPEPAPRPGAQGLTELDLLRALGCDV